LIRGTTSRPCSTEVEAAYSPQRLPCLHASYISARRSWHFRSSVAVGQSRPTPAQRHRRVYYLHAFPRLSSMGTSCVCAAHTNKKRLLPSTAVASLRSREYFYNNNNNEDHPNQDVCATPRPAAMPSQSDETKTNRRTISKPAM